MTTRADKPLAVESTGVRKIYRSSTAPAVVALEALDLTIPSGQIIGLLGPHRAGKTTLLKILGGTLKPSRGMIRIYGYDLRCERQEALRHVGLVGEDVPPPASMAVWEYVLAGTPKPPKQRSRAARVLRALGLWHLRYARLAHCSPSLRYALAFAQAYVAAPPLLLVDLPIVARDQPETAMIISWMTELVQQGCTVVLATRQPELAAHLCTRVLVVRSGRVIADFAHPHDMLAFQPTCYAIRVKGHLPAHWSEWFENFTLDQEQDGNTLLYGRIADQADLHGLLLKIRNLGLSLLSVTPLPVTVDAFCQRTGGEAALQPT